MRKLILQIDVSLDGYTAAADGATDWIHADDDMNRDASDLLDTADTILLGRVAYQAFVQYWPFADTTAPTLLSRITGQINRADKIVFSRTLEQVEWGEWNNARLVSDNIAESIAAVKAQPGKNLLLYAGAGIISSIMRLGLIDEYRLRIHPVALGAGKPLFQNLEDRLGLEFIQAKPYKNGVLLLVYQPAAK